MNIHFLYGSQSGTAEILCDNMVDSLSDGFEGKVSSLDEVDPADLDAETFYILVSATFGSGQVPDSAQKFLENLEERKPDLSHVRFAIFGLGDRTFGETFNNGSNLLMTQMLACNAQMVGERGLHDASAVALPQKVALPWLKDILTQIAA